MSLYREAERRRKRRRQRERGGGKKSSLGAALSASLTALFTGGKGSDCPSDHGDCDYYYGGVNAADRVEYVTVRGCRPERGDGDGGELSSGDENHGNVDEEDVSANGNAYYDRTKGLAQMAVALGEFKKSFFIRFPPCTLLLLHVEKKKLHKQSPATFKKSEPHTHGCPFLLCTAVDRDD
jgi:hypothetical protein